MQVSTDDRVKSEEVEHIGVDGCVQVPYKLALDKKLRNSVVVL